jgi:nucleoid-associated protein YgaU
MLMAKYTLLRCAACILVLAVMAGCATAPTQEMSDARQAVQAARAAGAPLHTPVAMESAEHELSQAEHELRGRNYKIARNDALSAKQGAIKARNMALAISQAKDAIAEADKLGALSQSTRERLAQAETAAAAGNEDQAVQDAQLATQLARDDVSHFNEEQQRAVQENQAWLDKAKPLLEEARQATARMSGLQQEALRRAEEAYQQGEGQKSYNLADFIVAEVRALPPEPPPPPRTLQYQVTNGDNLWRIAAKPSVYGNGLWWPLILRSNQDKIRDADVISPGLELTIELKPAQALIDRAVRYAIQREGTGAKMKAQDKEFLKNTQ